MSMNRLLLAALCMLPAAGLETRLPHAPLVATFMYACDASRSDPKVTSRYTGAGRPRPTPDSVTVEVYMRGRPPGRPFRPIGEVKVLATTGRMMPAELTDWASRRARKLGGDAIVDVWWEDAGSVTPKAGDVGLLYLTAEVVRWE
jgi:hypothetical protein